MTTKQVTKQEENGRALAIPTGGVAGLSGEFNQRDIALPVCSLAQPMSQDKGPEGKFSWPDGRSVDQMTVVVLDIVATRALWSPIDWDVGEPICRSSDRLDGLTKYANIVTAEKPKAGDIREADPIIISCAECPHFKDATTFPDQELRCMYGYTLLLVEREGDGLPFLYFVKGSAVKVIKQRIVSPALMRLRVNKPAEPWAQPSGWTIVLKQEKQRKWYVPEIMPLEPLGEEEKDLYATMSAEFSGRASQQTLEDEPVTENGDAPPPATDHPGLGN